MARQEQEREDLLREATALVERIEIVPADHDEPIVIGFRSNGAASMYFGGDPVYHFNSNGELRRAFIDGQIYKSIDRKLVSLPRERINGEVRLIRRELTGTEQAQALDVLVNHLDSLRKTFSSHAFEISGQVPDGVNLVGRVTDWLMQQSNISIARAPNVV